jgi:hypothetical protein
MASIQLNFTFPALNPVLILLPVGAIFRKFVLRTSTHEDKPSAAQACFSSPDIKAA